MLFLSSTSLGCLLGRKSGLTVLVMFQVDDRKVADDSEKAADSDDDHTENRIVINTVVDLEVSIGWGFGGSFQELGFIWILY